MQVFAIKLVFQSDIFVYNLGLTLSLHLKRTIMRYKKLKALFSFFLFCRPIIVAQKASNVLLDILQFLQRIYDLHNSNVHFLPPLVQCLIKPSRCVEYNFVFKYNNNIQHSPLPTKNLRKVKTKWTTNSKWLDPSPLALPRLPSHTEQLSCTGNNQIFIFLNFSSNTEFI